ncbi:MAG: hypothetical protein JXA19_01310 [Anaerolineales bacterium]|nr:hypothetical protein [Anaerolineales bacterium]
MLDTKPTLKKRENILGIIEEDLGAYAKKSSKYYFWHCPFHSGDNSPSLAVTENNGFWYCFGCGKRGDAIGWLMEYRRFSYPQAREYLSLGMNTWVNNSKRLEAPETLKTHKTLPDDLQAKWKEIIAVCERSLWQDQGKRAREYLHKRGLNDETLQNPFWKIGYSPGQKIAGIWVDRGIILPCFKPEGLGVGYVDYIKIRRPTENPKYKKLPGHGCNLSGLYTADKLGAEITFFTEGEFDALLLWQEAREFIGVATLGGAVEKLDFSRFGYWLSPIKQIFTVYDKDRAGEMGADYWRGISKRVINVSLSVGKDITEYWLAGGNLKKWVLDTLSLYSHEDQKAQETGPKPN